MFSTLKPRPSVLCVHCRKPVHTDTAYGQGGTYWTHDDGYRECEPTYAAPDLIRYNREMKETVENEL